MYTPPPSEICKYKQFLETEGPFLWLPKCFITTKFFLLPKALSNNYFSLSLFILKDNTPRKDLYKNQTSPLSTGLVLAPKPEFFNSERVLNTWLYPLQTRKNNSSVTSPLDWVRRVISFSLSKRVFSTDPEC